MVDPQASRFWQVGLQSGLIDAEALQACFDAIVPEKRVAEHLDRRLARQAIQQGRLSLWQAQQLLAGRSSGYRIDRYTILDMIGQGGMGRVYLARDTRLNRRVALKILSPERMNNPRAIARFQREARVGAQLQHENLVRIYDEGEANGKCYLVMEYIEGKNIGAIIAEDGPIPPATAARLARQVALGLEHAQQKGLIHRDVNPYNILVTRDGVAKLTDLGLAIDLSEDVQVTREGATVGTFDYISPEQARHSHAVDTRSDIYSLGCTLYHMLTGQVPFPSPSLPEKLFAHQGVEPVPVTKLVPNIPEELAAVVHRMMRKSPDERYQTPWDVAQALDFLADLSGASPLASHPRTTSARVAGRSSMTETQIVATPRIASEAGAAPAATMAAALLPEASPVPITAAGAGAASRSDDGWAGLGLAIDLGPEPSLTEGLSVSRKKKSKSSSGSADSDPSTSGIVPAAIPPPGAEEAGAAATAPEMGKDGRVNLGVALNLLGAGSTLSTSREARAKAATPAMATAEAEPSPTPPSRGLSPIHRWMIGLVGVIGIGAAVAGVLFGFGLFGRAKPVVTKKEPSPPPIEAARPTSVDDDRPAKVVENTSQTKTGPASAKGKGKGKGRGNRKDAPEIPAGQPIAVKMPDGQVVFESSLKSAMQRAIGSKGHVLLDNRTPLKLSGPDAEINISGGRLFIRAAEGVRPVLEVEIKGQKPFLSTRTDTALTIVGVSIEARYGDKPKAVPALIEAGGNVTLERCAFTATGAVKGSRAVAAEGRDLTVDGCWFEGFDTALDVASFAVSTTTIRQSMLVRAATDDRPIGWAVRVRRIPGVAAKDVRQLSMEHCTVKGEGLLHLVDFSAQAPLQVDLKACAVLADAVLAWETPKPETPPTPDALVWKGQGNQYDIRGKSWIILSPEGTPELPDGPGDLASWRSTMRELGPLRPPIRFRTSPESLSESPTPHDFGMIDHDVETPGADPARVGPTVPAPPGRR